MRISTTHTLDGTEVVPGLLVWDYDMRPRRVGEVAFRSHGTTWYEMFDLDTGRRGSDMDPSRMWFRHPATGRKVPA